MKAALLVAHNAPLALCEVEPGPLAFGQVRVRVQASGLCGAQLQEIRGEKGGPLPHLLGHEGCGIVEEIGDAVTRMKVGDKVVIHWRKAAGIESPIPEYWAKPPGSKLQIPITSGRCVSLAEEVICSENRLTPVPLDTPRELCALLGCSMSTALATIERDAALLPGERIMVVGCGGLGVNLIRAARGARASFIVAVDVHERKKPVARAMGADRFHSSTPSDPSYLSESHRCNCIVDTVGNTDSVSGAFRHLAPGGRYILVGQPAPGASLTLPNARQLFDGEGQSIRATQGGGFRPDLDIPRYLEMHRRGDLKLTGLISHYLPLSKINTAIDHLKNGDASRILIEMQ